MIKKLLALFLVMVYVGMSQVCMAITSFEQIDVQKNQIPLTSRLKKEYSGYEYVITNNLKQPINIVNAQIVNGQDGNMGYQKTEAEGAMGVTWAIAGPVGLFTLGIGWAVGLLATPIVWVVQNNKNKKNRAEGMAYTNIVPVGVLNSAESVSVKTLVPIGAQPQLKMTIMDSKKELHTINR
jgi:hypothetical protein